MNKSDICENYSDDSCDSDDLQEMCIERTTSRQIPTINLKQKPSPSARIGIDSENDSDNCRKLKGLLCGKIGKSKTFTIDNILGIENDERNENADKRDTNKCNDGFFGKTLPISPTALRQICKYFFDNY